MLNIAEGIAKKIKSVFADEKYRVYMDSAEQGVQKPCFFVLQISRTQVQILNIRYHETQSFVVQYFPEGKDVQKECDKVSSALYDALELLSVPDGLIRGTNMKSEIRDDVLRFFVEYHYHILKEKEPEEWMREVNVIGKAKQ